MAERVSDILTAVQREIPNADMRDFFAITGRHMTLLATEKNWRFYEKEYDFTLTASVPVVDVTVINGDATVTCASSTFTAGMVGRKIRVSGNHTRVYEILTYTSGTSIELDANWEGDSYAATASALVFVDEYTVPSDFRRERLVFNKSDQYQLVPTTYQTMINEYYQYRALTGTRPQYYTFKDFVDSSGTESRQIWFDTAPQMADAMTLFYWRNPTEPSVANASGRLDMPVELSRILLYDVVLHYAARPEYFEKVSPETRAYLQSQRNMHFQQANRNNTLLSNQMVYFNQGALFAPTRRPGTYRRF